MVDFSFNCTSMATLLSIDYRSKSESQMNLWEIQLSKGIDVLDFHKPGTQKS